MNATPSHTEVVSTVPAHISAGGDIIVNGNITNQDSSIMAGGMIIISGGSVTNSATQGQNITHYTNGSSRYTWVESCGTFGGSHCREWSGVSAYNPAPKYEPPYDLATVTFLDGATPSITPPSNSLFTHSPDVSRHYLIETDPRFVNYRDWLSSDYMLTALSYDPALTQKRLGDGFYEQSLIHQQIAQLTGRRFLDGYASDEAQYQALMNNAVTVAQQWDLRPGIALSPNQVAQLTSDIVWLVARDITLADGTHMNALVPHVYTRTLPGDLHSSGSLLSANTLHLNLSGDLSNNGSLAGRDVVIINADTIHNLGGQINANTVQLDAKNDINNIGGTFAADESLILNAGHDLRVETTTHSSQSTPENNTFSRTSVERVAGLYVTDPNGVIVANAGNDIELIGALLTNNGAQSQTSLTAGRDLNLGAVTAATQENIIWDNNNHRHEGNSQDNGSLLQGQGGLTLQAGHNINIKAASVNAGQLIINAANDIQINAGNTTHTFDEAHKITSKGLLSSKVSISRHRLEASKAMGSTLSADSVKMTSGHNLTIVGSNIVSSQDTNLSAINDLSIKAAQHTFSKKQFNQTQRSGLISSGGVGFTIGRQNLATTDTQHQINNAASTVGSLEGNVNLEAGKAYQQTASDVLALQGNINITAQKVDIAAATDVFTNEHTTKFKQTGITVAITSPVISAIQTAQQMSQAVSQTSDSRMQLLAAGTVALSAKNAANTTMDALNAPASKAGGLRGSATDAANQVGGINLSLSLGTSKSSRTSTQINTSVASSHLTTGGDIHIKATGADTNTGATSDINIIGSQVKANGDVTLNADNNLNLLAASNTSKLDGNNKNSSASIGIGVGSIGFAVTANASAGKGQEKGNDTTWTETVIQSGNQAGDKVTLNSGANTNLIGAQVTGNQVIANVGTKLLTGGNLNIQSLQDTDQYSAQQKSQGFSVSIPIGTGAVGGSISASSSKTKSNYQSVQEQAGIFAGDSGFQVNVAGNTDLKGAVIASTDKAIQDNKNSLTTQTLITSNIENKAKYDAKAASATIGGGLQAGLPQLSGAGLGSDSGKESSTTVSAISVGTLNVTKDSDELSKAAINRDVYAEADTNGNLIAVNGQGNNLANTVKPIFDAGKVAREIQAQVHITQEFGQQANLVVESYVHSARTNLLMQLKSTSNDTEKALIQLQLSNLTMEERVMNVLIGAVTGTGGAVLTKEGLSLAAEKMRQITIESSKRFAGITDSTTELSNIIDGKSIGVRSDGIATGGTRVDLDRLCGPNNERCKHNVDGSLNLNGKGQVQFDTKAAQMSLAEFLESDKGKQMYGTTGGIQGWKGTLFGIPYQAGSWQDNLIESFGGTHDVIGGQLSGLYDEQGNAMRGRTYTVIKVQDTWSATGAIVVSTPFAMSELLPSSVWQAISILLGSAK